jgi:hypothetical protein
MVRVQIELSNFEGDRVCRIERPRKLIVRCPFGAMRARCFVETTLADRLIPIEHGYECRIFLEEQLKFVGRVESIRRDTIGDELSFSAERFPERDMTEAVQGEFENQTPTEILASLIAGLEYAPLFYVDDYPSTHVIDKVHFHDYDLYYAIDLLAKLAGNYLWEVGWDNRLRFRPNTLMPDHVLYYDPRRWALKIWQTTERVKNYFEFSGGLAEGQLYTRTFYDEDSVARYGVRREQVFARPISTDSAFQYLRTAILEQHPRPVFEKYIDLYDESVEVGPGDTLQLRNIPLAGLDEGQVFRVKLEELVVDPVGRLRCRYYLADLWESASRFLRYLDHEKRQETVDFAARRVGSIQLDLSALDSQAHLD